MSSITIFARGDRALMLTDTAGTDSEFVVGAWANKVATVPHLKVAITAQGAAEAVSVMSDALVCACGSFDAMIRDGAALLEEHHDANMMRWSDQAGCPEFKLGIVGWSEERRRFEAYFIQSTDALGVEPFTFVRRDLVLAPMLHDTDLAAIGVPKDGAAFAANAEAILLRVIALQRHVTSPRPGADGGGAGYLIGGSVVATDLTPDGISQRVVHQWADKLGEPIRPEPVAVELRALVAGQTGAPPVAGMSRQDRRAAKAQARKAPAHAA